MWKSHFLEYLWCASVANTMEIKSQWTCYTREECKFILSSESFRALALVEIYEC